MFQSKSGNRADASLDRDKAEQGVTTDALKNQAEQAQLNINNQVQTILHSATLGPEDKIRAMMAVDPSKAQSLSETYYGKDDGIKQVGDRMVRLDRLTGKTVDYGAAPTKERQVITADDGRMFEIPTTGPPVPLVDKDGKAILGTPKDGSDRVIIQEAVGGKSHNILLNKRTGEKSDLGPTGFKPDKPTDPLTHELASQRLLDSEYNKISPKWQKRQTDAEAAIQKASDTLSDLDPKNKAVGQALGVPKLLTALVSGAGSGVRITQAELSSIAHARGIQGDVIALFQRWTTGNSLTPDQVHQMQGILRDVREKLFEKRNLATSSIDSMRRAPDRESLFAADHDGDQAWGEALKNEGGSNNGGHVININGKSYQYKGSGATDDMKNYTEVKK